MSTFFNSIENMSKNSVLRENVSENFSILRENVSEFLLTLLKNTSQIRSDIENVLLSFSHFCLITSLQYKLKRSMFNLHLKI